MREISPKFENKMKTKFGNQYKLPNFENKMKTKFELMKYHAKI